MSEKTKNIWQEIDSDLREKTQSGYKMALLDSDKLLRNTLKEKGYPGKDLKKQLFWAGINLKGRADLKDAFKKKEEILTKESYRLSTFELEDYLNAYKKAISWVESARSITLRRKVGLYFESYFFLKNAPLTKIIATLVIVFLGIKFLSSTETGKSIVTKVVEIDNLLFEWLKIILLIGLALAVVIFVSFIYLDKKKNVRIKE